MGVRYSIRQDVVIIEFEGTYEPHDIKRKFLEALGDSKCPTPAALLIDVTRSKSLATRPAADIRTVAEFLGPFADRIGSRVAVVASSDVHYGLSQMGAVYSERVGVAAKVFRTSLEALAWLKSPPAALA
jgi:hypothetical protein